jgi:hypothetical protein
LNKKVSFKNDDDDFKAIKEEPEIAIKKAELN